MIPQAKGIYTKASVVILISDKIDFEITNVTWNEDWHIIMIKGIPHQGNITFLNIYVPNQKAFKYIQQLLTELKGETKDKNTII